MLGSLTQAEPPLGTDWEIIVVNNNCTDDTDIIVEQFSKRLPLKRVFEPKPGLSHARNTGMDAASGDYLLWTDDDVTVGHNWLKAYQSAFESWPEASVFGGPIIPRFEGSPPDWMEAALHHMPFAYSGIDLGDTHLMLDSSSAGLPFGANMALRVLEQRQFRYDTRLGRRPGPTFISFEETEVLKRILATGKTGWWLPDTAVEHWIPRSRQTVDYLRAYFHGVGQILASTILQPRRLNNNHKGARAFIKAVKLEAIFRYHRSLSSPEKWLPALQSSSLAWGKLTGLHTPGFAPKP